MSNAVHTRQRYDGATQLKEKKLMGQISETGAVASSL